MNNDEKYKKKLCETKINFLNGHKFLRGKRGLLKMAIREEIEMLFDLGSLDVCLERSQFFNKEGVMTMDYSERIIKLSDKKFILAGIRFYGLDVSKPFISVCTGVFAFV